LLPDKCKETYFAAFYMVRKQIQDMKLSFNVQSMRSDFEIGEMKAAAAAWDIVVKGCYYHFTQSGWRFVQNNGMASAYLSDSDQCYVYQTLIYVGFIAEKYRKAEYV
jgi:hypothetical protein